MIDASGEHASLNRKPKALRLVSITASQSGWAGLHLTLQDAKCWSRCVNLPSVTSMKWRFFVLTWLVLACELSHLLKHQRLFGLRQTSSYRRVNIHSCSNIMGQAVDIRLSEPKEEKTHLSYFGVSLGAPCAPLLHSVHLCRHNMAALTWVTLIRTNWCRVKSAISLTSFSFPPSLPCAALASRCPPHLSYQGKRTSPLRFLLIP